mmetsp:Transcript_29675/g.55937  ORF Transcript_29675/g.55937 Transcript_29675/m.55937 type:complete len:318 (+) Transcript_29675:2569-3522(+)
MQWVHRQHCGRGGVWRRQHHFLSVERGHQVVRLPPRKQRGHVVARAVHQQRGDLLVTEVGDGVVELEVDQHRFVLARLVHARLPVGVHVQHLAAVGGGPIRLARNLVKRHALGDALRRVELAVDAAARLGAAVHRVRALARTVEASLRVGAVRPRLEALLASDGAVAREHLQRLALQVPAPVVRNHLLVRLLPRNRRARHKHPQLPGDAERQVANAPLLNGQRLCSQVRGGRLIWNGLPRSRPHHLVRIHLEGPAVHVPPDVVVPRLVQVGVLPHLEDGVPLVPRCALVRRLRPESRHQRHLKIHHLLEYNAPHRSG